MTNRPAKCPADMAAGVLIVSPFADDFPAIGPSVTRMAGRPHRARTLGEAIEFVAANPVAVVVCEHKLPDGTWRDLIEGMARSAAPPLLVVTSVNADESLWVEVLNLGGYDVLAKPYRSDEVLRTVSLARARWIEQRSKARAADLRCANLMGEQVECCC